MIYLSRLKFNPRSRTAWDLINQPYELHRTLAKGFSDVREEYEAARPLFRLEPETDKQPQVIVQSKLPADWNRLLDSGAPFLDQPEQKEVRYSFVEARTLTFRLRANPCRSVKGEKRGERVPIWEPKPFDETLYERDERMARIEKAREEWLLRKGKAGGFQVLRVAVIPEGAVKAGKSVPNVTHNAVLYEGVLRVTEPAVFLATVEAGIGPGKGFGFGLLSLAKA